MVVCPSACYHGVMSIQRKLPVAPERLPRPGEVPDFGMFRGRTADTDTARWDGGLRRWFQRKTWTYAGVFSERLYVGLAVVDAGFLATAFIYVYDRRTERLTEHKVSRPFGFSRGWQPGLDTRWELSSRTARWAIIPESEGWRITFSGPDIDVEIELGDSPEGLSTLAPAQSRPFHYTYKLAGVPARVKVVTPAGTISEDTSGVLDFSKGYPPRHMYWNWASFVGATSEGERFGLNLVADFNNGLENVVWVGETLIPLSQALFRYDRQRLSEPWHVRTLDERVDVRFFPEGSRSENISVGVMASRFAQPFGTFEGRILMPTGEERLVSGHGVVEQHLAVW